MKFGVWYGMAMWFLILKGLDVAPFAEWHWWLVLVLIAWPNLPEIGAFLSKQGERFALYVRSFGKRKLDDTSAPFNATRKQS